MEDLLLFTPDKKKTRRWGSLKGFFRRKQQQPASGDPKSFVILKEGDEQDHTTVNLSHSGSNPYSVDESFDSFAEKANRSMNSAPSTTPHNDAFDFEPDRTDDVQAFQDEFSSFTGSSFAQLDLPTSQMYHSTPSILDRSMLTSMSRGSDENAFAFSTRSALDQQSVVASSAVVSSDLGMEVMLSDQEDDQMDGVFMSFQAPMVDERHDRLNNSERLNFSDQFPYSAASDVVPTRRKLSNFNRTDYAIPESPALSAQSESLTWVSHDEDDTDERPVKEIVFPTLTDDSMEDLFLDNETTTDLDGDASEAPTPQGSVRDAIFALLEDETIEKTPEPKKIDMFFNRLSMQRRTNMPESVQRRNSAPVNTSGLSNDAGSWDRITDTKLPVRTTPASPLSSNSRRAPSTAFLKRKSAFTGEDLLYWEAESFAEFLEEGHEKEPVPPPITSKPISSKSMISTEERLLIALTGSVDSSEAEAPLATSESRAYSERSAALATSVDLSDTGTGTIRSSAASHSRTSTALFSKSMSFDTSFASTSDAASTSFTPSSIPESRKYNRSTSYCGIFAEEDDDDDDDELTLRSEDFVSPHKESHPRQNRVETPLLDQVRMELLETVQDLARESSTAMMQFLLNKK